MTLASLAILLIRKDKGLSSLAQGLLHSARELTAVRSGYGLYLPYYATRCESWAACHAITRAPAFTGLLAKNP